MKVLILGLGSIAKKHIAALQAIDESIQFFALRSSKSSSIYPSVENIYSMDEALMHVFDFAIISNPTSEHQRSIELLRSIHCPLFIEKPLSNQLSIEKTVNETENKGILTYVGCNLRFLKSLQFVKQMIDSGNEQINEINAYCGSYLPEWRKDGDFRKIYSALPELGGGVHLDLIHELDYLYWIFGIPVKTHRIFSNHSTLEIDAVDYANYCLEYPSFCASVILNYYRRDFRRSLEIVFRDRTIAVDLVHNVVTSSDSGIIFESDQTVMDTFKDQMEYFLALIKAGETRSFNAINDAYNVLKICLNDDIKG